MTSEHDSRPRPQYGEYADPSAEQQVEVAEDASAPKSADPSAALDQAPTFGIVVPDSAREENKDAAAPPVSASAHPAAASRSTPTFGPLPGVPHNLGAKGSTAPQQYSQPQAAASSALIDPVNQPGSKGPELAAKQATSAPAAPGGTQTRPRGADRIVTIALLAIGAYFALSMALTLSQFTLEFSRVADQLGVKDFTAPPILSTLGTIGAILVLAIYALVLIFSIRRLRARKVTFWAPLIAGVLAWVLFFVLFFIGLNQSAELWQALLGIASDPAAAQQMLERLNSNG